MKNACYTQNYICQGKKSNSTIYIRFSKFAQLKLNIQFAINSKIAWLKHSKQSIFIMLTWYRSKSIFCRVQSNALICALFKYDILIYMLCLKLGMPLKSALVQGNHFKQRKDLEAWSRFLSLDFTTVSPGCQLAYFCSPHQLHHGAVQGPKPTGIVSLGYIFSSPESRLHFLKEGVPQISELALITLRGEKVSSSEANICITKSC